MSCGIYKITNLVNNKIYIGQSIDIEDRWNKEKTRAFRPSYEHYNKTLFKAFRKYGLSNFKFEIVQQCEIQELDELEQYYINLYNSYIEGYNDTIGGQLGNHGNSVKISKEQLLEIYELLQNSTLSQKEIAIKFNVGQDVISTINQGKSRRLTGYQFPLRQNHHKKNNKCKKCGKIISSNAEHCEICSKEMRRKTSRPTREELKILIKNMPFTQIGEKFGVSDNTIRKWCNSYNLPNTKKIINNYSDEEWDLI